MKPYHLSQEQFTNHILGFGDEQSRSHLKGCSACETELHNFRSTLTNFNSATSTWSEKAAGKIVRKIQPHRVSSFKTAAWISVAVCVTFVLSLFFFRTDFSGIRNRNVSAGVESSSPELHRQIDKDNTLLAEINSALSTPVESPEKLYAIEEAPHESTPVPEQAGAQN